MVCGGSICIFRVFWLPTAVFWQSRFGLKSFHPFSAQTAGGGGGRGDGYWGSDGSSGGGSVIIIDMNLWFFPHGDSHYYWQTLQTLYMPVQSKASLARWHGTLSSTTWLKKMGIASIRGRRDTVSWQCISGGTLFQSANEKSASSGGHLCFISENDCFPLAHSLIV